MQNELYLIHQSLQLITKEMRHLNLKGDREEPLRYELYLVFDKKVGGCMATHLVQTDIGIDRIVSMGLRRGARKH